MFASASTRLVLRALLAGLGTFAATLNQSTSFNRSVVIGAITAAVWAAVEYVTPINQLVGPKTGGTGVSSS